MTTWPRPRRRGVIAAASGAFFVALAGTIATSLALANPVTPAQHTINVVPPPPAAYSSTELQNAQNTACAAWDKAARSTALASRVSSEALRDSWRSPESVAALASEKTTGLAAVSYLSSQMRPATPASLAEPLQDWMTARLDMLHALNMRNWTEADRMQQQGNDLVNVIKAKCGF